MAALHSLDELGSFLAQADQMEAGGRSDEAQRVREYVRRQRSQTENLALPGMPPPVRVEPQTQFLPSLEASPGSPWMERAGLGVARSVRGLAQMPREVVRAFRPPETSEEAIYGALTPGALPFKRLIGDPQIQTAQAAIEAGRRGERGKAALYGAAAAVPLFGPAIPPIYETSESGDVAGAIGEGAFLAATLLPGFRGSARGPSSVSRPRSMRPPPARDLFDIRPRETMAEPTFVGARRPEPFRLRAAPQRRMLPAGPEAGMLPPGVEPPGLPPGPRRPLLAPPPDFTRTGRRVYMGPEDIEGIAIPEPNYEIPARGPATRTRTRIEPEPPEALRPRAARPSPIAEPATTRPRIIREEGRPAPAEPSPLAAERPAQLTGKGKFGREIELTEQTLLREAGPEKLAEVRQYALDQEFSPEAYVDYVDFEAKRARQAKIPKQAPTPLEPLPPRAPGAPGPEELGRQLEQAGEQRGRIQQELDVTGEQLRQVQAADVEAARVQQEATRGMAERRQLLERREQELGLPAGITERRLMARRGAEPAPPRLAAGPPPGEVGPMRVADIEVDPKRFQFKLNVNKQGVTGSLSGRRYNPELAGVVSVWTEPGTGKTYVVNGHHRLQLARENAVPNIDVRQIQAKTAGEARVKGALQNIAENQGSPMDVAMLLRESGIGPEGLREAGITATSRLAREGTSLANLDQRIFDRVALGDIPESRAIAIGEATADATQQWGILDLIENAEKKGRKVSDAAITELARLAKTSGTQTETVQTLFGAEERVQSLALDKAELSAFIKQQLGKEKRAFGFVSSEARAETLGRAGNVLKTEANKQIAQEAAQAIDAYDRLSSYTGPINDILESAAGRIAKGETPNVVREQAYQQVRAEIRKTLTGTGEGLERGAGREGVPGGQPESQGTLPGTEPEPRGFGQSNRVVKKDAKLEESQQKLKDFFGGGGTLRAGLDPTILPDVARVGAYYIEGGLREFAAWSDRMVRDFGERIRPHLDEAWESALKFGQRTGFGAEQRAPFITTEAAHKAARVEQLLADLSGPAQTILKEGEATFERGTVRREIREDFYGTERPGKRETYERKISEADVDRARNALEDSYRTTENWLREMQEMGDEAAIAMGRVAVGYLNQATKLFKETGTIGGRVLQSFQRRAQSQAGLPRIERPPAGGGAGRGGPAEARFAPGQSPAELMEQARVLVAQAKEALQGVRTFKAREPVTTGLVNAIRERRWNDVPRYAVDQLRLNLFSVGSWTLDAIGNAAELAGQLAGGLGHDLVYASRTGQVTFPSLTGFTQALKSRWRERGIPMDAEIERAFGRTAGGEKVGPMFDQPAGRRLTVKERLARPGTFTYRTTPASKALDVVQGIPLYAKGAMDVAAKRLAATATIFREASKLADARGLRGPQRQVFVEQFLRKLPKGVMDEAIREGNKAGFNRPLSQLEERVGGSVVYRLLGDAFARWPFQFTRWSGEMLGYNRPLFEKLRKGAATPEEVGAYIAKTATGYGGLLLINDLLYDRTDFNTMEYVTENGDRVRLAGREPVSSALWLLALTKGDVDKAAAGLKYASVPGGRVVQEGGPGGGLLGSFFQSTAQAVRNPQNDPRALKRELENTLNRAVPGQALLSTLKALFDPKLREGVGAQLPGVSRALPARVSPTTGGDIEPKQRVPGTKTPVPSIQGTPIPGMARVLDPVEKLLNRYGMVTYRGVRQPIAGFPPGEVPREYRREWEQEFGQERNRLLSPYAEALASGGLDRFQEEAIRDRLTRLDAMAARIATQRVNRAHGTAGQRLPRRPTLRERARPTIYQEEPTQ